MSTLAMRALMNEVKQRRGARLFDLPASGQISASDINVELGRAFNAPFNIDGVEERELAGIPSGEIKFSDFHGKSSITNVMLVGTQVGLFGYQSGAYGNLTPDTIAGSSVINVFNVYIDATLKSVQIIFLAAQAFTNITVKWSGGTLILPSVTSDTYRALEDLDPIAADFFDYIVANNGLDVNLVVIGNM